MTKQWTFPHPVKSWTTGTGLKALIAKNSHLGFYLGYVSVGKSHPAYGKDYNDDVLREIQVHGGLTFANKVEGVWWLGFDCGHGYSGPLGLTSKGWTRDEVEQECESLAKQLAAMEKGEE